VLLRVDMNVPLDSRGRIMDDLRIRASLPTLERLIDKGARRVILLSHLGRPQCGDTAPSLKVCAERLNRWFPTTWVPSSVGMRDTIEEIKTSLVMLENLRFQAGELSNDQAFARELASYASCYVNDAFALAHRSHASVVALPLCFSKNRRAAGLLMEKELKSLNLHQARRPIMVILGGAKVADKLPLISHLYGMSDHLFVGGKMAYPILHLLGKHLGDTSIDTEEVEAARRVIPLLDKISLPIDFISSSGDTVVLPQGSLASEESTQPWTPGASAMSIGPNTVEYWKQSLMQAGTVLWNGPLGYVEEERFAQPTHRIAQYLERLSAYTIAGGGDSVAAIHRTGVQFDHLSTGGGAFLAYLGRDVLPALEALETE